MTRHTDRSNDDGLGLIELVVAIVVSGIVIGAMVTIFVNSWNTQKEVLSVSEATNRGQLVGSLFEQAVRNAVDMQYTDGPNGDTLLVRTSLDPECRGFYVGQVTTASGTIATVTTASSAGLLPSSTAWRVWEPRITLDPAESSINETEGNVSYDLLIDTNSAPVRIEGEVGQRTLRISGGNPCW